MKAVCEITRHGHSLFVSFEFEKCPEIGDLVYIKEIPYKVKKVSPVHYDGVTLLKVDLK